jgi:hypothetical protein
MKVQLEVSVAPLGHAGGTICAVLCVHSNLGFKPGLEDSSIAAHDEKLALTTQTYEVIYQGRIKCFDDSAEG